MTTNDVILIINEVIITVFSTTWNNFISRRSVWRTFFTAPSGTTLFLRSSSACVKFFSRRTILKWWGSWRSVKELGRTIEEIWSATSSTAETTASTATERFSKRAPARSAPVKVGRADIKIWIETWWAVSKWWSCNKTIV